MPEPPRSRVERFPVGAAATLGELEGEPHPLLHRLRATEPVSWLPVLDGWLVTRRDLALDVMRDAETFTVDDPRFSTAQVIGPSMLSLDGVEHAQAPGSVRAPVPPRGRAGTVHRDRRTRGRPVARARSRHRVAPISAAISPGRCRSSRWCTRSGSSDTEPATALGWYAAIVEAVTQITAGRAPGTKGTEAFAALRASIEPALDRDAAASLVAAAAGEAGVASRGPRWRRMRACCCSAASRRRRR